MIAKQLQHQTTVPVNHPEHRRGASRWAVWETAVRPQPMGVSPGAPQIRYTSLFKTDILSMIEFKC